MSVIGVSVFGRCSYSVRAVLSVIIKIKTNVITMPNLNRNRQSNEPIRTRSIYMRGENACKQVTLVLVLLLSGSESGAKFLANHKA